MVQKRNFIKLAEENEQNLSEIEENYFKSGIVNRITVKERQPSPKVRKPRGIIKTQ